MDVASTPPLRGGECSPEELAKCSESIPTSPRGHGGHASPFCGIPLCDSLTAWHCKLLDRSALNWTAQPSSKPYEIPCGSRSAFPDAKICVKFLRAVILRC